MSSAETRQRLIDRGRIAFAAKGHDNVSLQRDVLKPAGVSNGSFYHQFQDKTDLLIAVLEDSRERGRTFAQGAVPDSTDTPRAERMKQRMEVWLGLLEHGEDLYRIQVRERDNNDERVRNLIADFQAGSFAPMAQRLATSVAAASDTFDPERAALFVRRFIETTSLAYLDLPHDQRIAQRSDMARDMAAFIIGGVTRMAGITHTSEASK